MKQLNILFRLALLLVLCFAAFTIGRERGVAVAFLLFFVVDALLAPRRRAYCYDNVLGTLATDTIVQEALDLVFTNRPELSAFSMGFTDQNGSPVAAFNKSVITRLKGLPTVNDFGSAASATADVDVPVLLDQFKEVAYQFTPQEYSATNRDLVRERAEPMSIAIGNYMVDQITSLFTVGNYPVRTGTDAVANGSTNNVTVLGAGYDYSHLLTVGKALDKSGVPESSRFYIGNSDVYTSMQADMRIVAALNNADNASAIKTGKLPMVNNFAIGKYPALSTAAGGNLVAVAGTADCAAYAARIPRDPRELLPGAMFPGRIGVVTHPKTKFSVMVLEYIGVDLKITTKIIWMFGKAVGNKNNVQLIKGQ